MPRFPNIPPFAKAVLILLMAIFLFNTMSVIIKHLGGRYPVQLLSAFRNLFGLIPGSCPGAWCKSVALYAAPGG